MTEHCRGRLCLSLYTKRHIGFRDAHQGLFNMDRRLVVGNDHPEAVDGRQIIMLLKIVARHRHL